MDVLMFTSLALLAYAYLLYPVVVWLWGWFRPLRVRRREITPRVSVLVPAYNEARHIARKIRNTLQLDYPRDRLEVVVVSDGSTDGTREISGMAGGEGVKVVSLPERRGKPAAINAGVGHCTGEILVLTDASSLLDPCSLRRLVSNFADLSVGCASGMLVPPRGQAGLGTYRSVENFVRASESRVHSSVGATGAMFAVRRSLMRKLPDDTILDDLMIPLNAIRRGYRCVFDRRAHCIERESITHKQEFVRKVRTLAGNYQAFMRQPWALVPFVSPIWFTALSHKILRLFCPALLLTLLFSSAAAAWQGCPAAQWLLIAQGVFYLAALCGRVVPPRLRASKAFVPYSFCVLNAAALVAPFAYFMGKAGVRWHKEPAVEHAR